MGFVVNKGFIINFLMTNPILIYGHPVLRKVADDIEKDYPVFSSN
jgi:hypothetical protein